MFNITQTDKLLALRKLQRPDKKNFLGQAHKK